MSSELSATVLQDQHSKGGVSPLIQRPVLQQDHEVPDARPVASSHAEKTKALPLTFSSLANALHELVQRIEHSRDDQKLPIPSLGIKLEAHSCPRVIP